MYLLDSQLETDATRLLGDLGKADHQRTDGGAVSGSAGCRENTSQHSGQGWGRRTITLPASGRGDHQKPDTRKVTPCPGRPRRGSQANGQPDLALSPLAEGGAWEREEGPGGAAMAH